MSKHNPSNTIAQPPRLHRAERTAENFVRVVLRRSGGASLDSKTIVSTEIRQSADMRDYLAAERTFLAWIRTGLALMGFGFVVARFGLFLQQFSGGLVPHHRPACRYGLALRSLQWAWS
jgi:Domain of unknown function (DUF202)